MKIKNRHADAIPAHITPEQFAKAISQLDLASIPPDKRRLALTEHIGRIMSETVADLDTRRHLQETRLMAASLPRNG
jgi:predicted DCC family thiol-disulfide oxidoreductase YuxK